MARLAAAISISDISDAKELAKAALVAFDRAGQITMTAPEKYSGLIAGKLHSNDVIAGGSGPKTGTPVFARRRNRSPL